MCSAVFVSRIVRVARQVCVRSGCSTHRCSVELVPEKASGASVGGHAYCRHANAPVGISDKASIPMMCSAGTIPIAR